MIPIRRILEKGAICLLTPADGLFRSSAGYDLLLELFLVALIHQELHLLRGEVLNQDKQISLFLQSQGSEVNPASHEAFTDAHGSRHGLGAARREYLGHHRSNLISKILFSEEVRERLTQHTRTV